MKKILSSVLCVLMLLSAFATVAFASEINTNACVYFYSAEEFTLSASKGWDGTMEISTGSDWSTWTGTSTTAVKADDDMYYIYVRGMGNTTVTNGNSVNKFKLIGTTNIYGDGNIMALINYQTLPTSMAGLKAGVFGFMFEAGSGTGTANYWLTSSPKLPATTLVKECYDTMFNKCTKLVKTPDLPATKIEYDSYYQMFMGCTGLTELPYLPGTSLSNGSYYRMFYNCSKIKLYTKDKAPEDCNRGWTISAVTSMNMCVTDMFGNTGGSFTGTPNGKTVYYTYGSDTKTLSADFTQIPKGMFDDWNIEFAFKYAGKAITEKTVSEIIDDFESIEGTFEFGVDITDVPWYEQLKSATLVE